jgi:uncharacterized protein YkwD
MSPVSRRSAVLAAAKTAVVTGLLGLTGFALVSALRPALALPRRAPSASPQQTIDLSSVENASEYRTDAPEGPGFIGSEAEVLDRSLARINQDLGTSLRPDNRLARLTRWVYGQIGPDNSLPPQSAMDALTRRLGLAEPLPHLLVIDAHNEPRLADVVSSRLAKVFDLANYTHIGGMAETEGRAVVVVIALSRRHIEMAPVPRSLSKPGRVRLAGRLVGAYAGSELAHTLPGGRTRIEDLGQGEDFRATVRLAETGRHRLEIIAQGPDGPDVVANFPIFVGVPVDDSVEAVPAPGVAMQPDEAGLRLFELINTERASSGLDALAFDPGLAEVALQHSEDMRANDFVAHVSPTTGSTEDRLLRAGIVTGLATENVSKGYAPDEIHRGFMDSPGHRAAILLAGATHVGIGVVTKREYGRTSYFVTELFIRRIPPLGPDAEIVFRKELNRLRALVGAPAVKEDPGLTRIAVKAARAFLAEPSVSQNKVLTRLRDNLELVDRRAKSYYSLFSVVGSLEEAAKQAASDTKTGQAGRVGIGIAQGDGPGLAPNSIILVLIFVR